MDSIFATVTFRSVTNIEILSLDMDGSPSTDPSLCFKRRKYLIIQKTSTSNKSQGKERKKNDDDDEQDGSEEWIYCGKWRPVHGVGWQKLFKSFHISHFSVPAAKFFIHFVSLDDEQTSTTYSTKIKSFQLRVSTTIYLQQPHLNVSSPHTWTFVEHCSHQVLEK